VSADHLPDDRRAEALLTLAARSGHNAERSATAGASGAEETKQR